MRDDGSGMSGEDLRLCTTEHATSKIRTIEDLEQSTSLGFRGEALSSIATVADLTITSATADDSSANRLHVVFGSAEELVSVPGARGTSVEVRRLFANLPARRKFLSRTAGESTAIGATILEKALPVPQVRFSWSSENGRLRALAPGTIRERVAAVFGDRVPAERLHEVHGTGERFRLKLIAAEPEIARRDRRLIQTYVNGRRVWEYKLIQGIEYAYQDVQHGGQFPAVALLLDIDPELVDFNIHPAKKEVRLRELSELRSSVVNVLRGFLRAWIVKRVQMGEELWATPPNRHEDPRGQRGDRWPKMDESTPRRRATDRATPVAHRPPPSGRSTPPPVPFGHEQRAVAEIPRADDLRFVGTLFDTFLIVERESRAFVIDQHAAHERILYDRFAVARSSQGLLVPEDFDVTADQDSSLRRHRDDYAKLGISLEPVAAQKWRLTALPAEYREQTEDLIETILQLHGLEEELDREFLAEMACKAAVRAGDYIDELSGLELARRTLALPIPRCPHGRPLWVELDRYDLEKLIGRR